MRMMIESGTKSVVDCHAYVRLKAKTWLEHVWSTAFLLEASSNCKLTS